MEGWALLPSEEGVLSWSGAALSCFGAFLSCFGVALSCFGAPWARYLPWL